MNAALTHSKVQLDSLCLQIIYFYLEKRVSVVLSNNACDIASLCFAEDIFNSYKLLPNRLLGSDA